MNNFREYTKYITKRKLLDLQSLKILIISFNEGEIKDMKNNQFEEFYKGEIERKNIDIIFIATQEYKINGALKTFVSNKGFINKNIEDTIPQNVTTISNLFMSTDPYFNLNVEISEFRHLQVDSKKVGKRSILTTCNVTKNGISYKIHFINTHLPFGGKDAKEFKYSDRKESFDNILKEFKIQQKYDDGDIIFICGDMNFRFHCSENQENLNCKIINGSDQLIINEQLKKIKDFYLTSPDKKKRR